MREKLRRALPGLEPGLRILAEGLPAQSGAIDLLGADAHGRLVLVFIDTGAYTSGYTDMADAEGALTLARALGTRAWVRAEMPGWLQLVPDLAMTQQTETRCLLLVRDLTPMLRAAIGALPAGWFEPLVYRPFSHRGDDFLLLEQVGPVDDREPLEHEEARVLGAGPPPSPEPDRRLPLPLLRSSLTDADFTQSRRNRRTGQERTRPRFDSPHEDAEPAHADRAPTTPQEPER